MAFDNSCFLIIGAYGGIGSVVCKILKINNETCKYGYIDISQCFISGDTLITFFETF